jgi:uncharacterized protein (DUF2062 family)
MFQLLQEITRQMGAGAWVALGVFLSLQVVIAILLLHWIRSGGLADGAAKRFLADGRKVSHWLRTR